MKAITLLAALLITASGFAQDALSFDKLKLEASYAHGYGTAFKMTDYIKSSECDDSELLKGVKDGFNDKSRFKAEEIQKLGEEYQDTLLKVRQSGNASLMSEKLKKDGSYVTGIALVNDVLKENFTNEIDLPQLLKGMEEGLASGRKIAAKLEKQNATIKLFTMAKMNRREEQGAKNLKRGTEFLAKNKKNKGVITLDSGLQYMVLKKSDDPKAPSPTLKDLIKVHYKGTLVDGTVFDSSYVRGQPSVFPLKGNIKGWTEALQKMKVGDKWKLFIPADLAYGEDAQPPVIGANEALIFEVELLGVSPMPATPPQP